MRKPRAQIAPPELRALRSLPIDQRAEALISMFRFVASEWAAMVLENVKVARRRRRNAKAKAKRKRRRASHV